MSGIQLKKPKKKTKDEGLWLMSFSDMSLILMSFFVLLLSMTTVNKQRFEAVKDHIEADTTKDASRTKENLEHLFRKIKNEVEAKGLQSKVEATYDNDGIHVELKDGSIFAPGSADIDRKLETTIGSVLAIMARAPEKYRLQIEGHTDDTPVGGHIKFRSNWELSAARGVALLEKFKKKGVSENRLSVISFAHTRPKVNVSDLNGIALKKARATNRRVVVTID